MSWLFRGFTSGVCACVRACVCVCVCSPSLSLCVMCVHSFCSLFVCKSNAPPFFLPPLTHPALLTFFLLERIKADHNREKEQGLLHPLLLPLPLLLLLLLPSKGRSIQGPVLFSSNHSAPLLSNNNNSSSSSSSSSSAMAAAEVPLVAAFPWRLHSCEQHTRGSSAWPAGPSGMPPSSPSCTRS